MPVTEMRQIIEPYNARRNDQRHDACAKPSRFSEAHGLGEGGVNARGRAGEENSTSTATEISTPPRFMVAMKKIVPRLIAPNSADFQFHC